MLAYSASKAAVIGLTKVIGKEYAESGITCNAVAPGVVMTPLVEALPQETINYMVEKIPMHRTGTIDEIASLVAFVASKESRYVHTCVTNVLTCQFHHRVYIRCIRRTSHLLITTTYKETNYIIING
jgi:NAD(P)-dependent dehydrogenase (short-subunit alcohol dehydrogenase family)